ncbi:BRO-N domain-containing protein [Yersinia proxima]
MQHQNSEAPTASNNQGLDLSATLSESTDMKSIANNQLTFHNTKFNPVQDKGQIWLTSSELAKALEYSSSKSISTLFSRNADEFSPAMTQVIEMMTSGNYRKKVRLFSIRGAHLIAMFSTTPVAKEFRRWVLDILDREVEKQPELTPFYRYKARLELRDDMTGETYEILGQAQDMRQVAFGLANDLGYRPNAFTHVPVNEKKLRKIH